MPAVSLGPLGAGPWLRLALIGVAVIAVLALFIRTVRESPSVDFEAYYAAVTGLRHGEGLYSRAAAYRDAGYALNHPSMDPPVEGMPYVYPPAFAIAVMPFSLLPYGPARLVWFAFIFACLIAAAYVLARLALPRSAHPPLAAVAGVTVLLAFFQPARANMVSTNTELPVFLLLTLMTAALARGRWSRAAVWLALAATVKPTLGIILLLFLWKRAYRPTAVALTLLAALFFAPTLVFGLGVVREFADVAAYWTQSPWAAGPINQSPYGLLLRLFTVNPYSSPVLDAPLLAGMLRWAIVGVTLAIVAASIDRSRAVSSRQIMLETGLFIAAMLLVSPLTQDIYCIHLAIPFAVLAGTALERPRARRSLLLGAGVALLYGYFSLPSLRLASQAFYRFYAAPLSGPILLLTGVYVYGLLAAIAVALLALRWYRRGEVGAAGDEATGPVALAR
jgi:hypothetical protein